MNLEGLVASLVALHEFLLDVGNASRCDERRRPILMRSNVVDDRARLDDPRPARQSGYTKAALPRGALFATERHGASIRPSEFFNAVVAGEDDDGVVGDSKIIELLKQLADHPVELHHAV